MIEALRGGRSIKEILLATGLRRDPRIDDIFNLAAEQGVTIRTVNRRELDTMSVRGAHQGVVARIEPFHYAALHDVIETVRESEEALVVLADGITDPQNLGSMIRTCEVAGAAALIVGRHRSARVGPAAVKAAAGATEHLPIVQATNLPAAIETLQGAGFWVTGLAPEGDAELWGADLTGKVTLVLGSEGGGLSRLVRERCDRLVRIPVRGRVGSLNVAAATAVAVCEVVRQQRRATQPAGPDEGAP